MGSQRTTASSVTITLVAKPAAGFTLMELLVSMSLIGLLAVAIHFGFRIGVNAWAKGDDGLQHVRTIQATFDLLTRQLGSMVPYYSQQKVQASPAEVLVYQGTERGMHFVTTFSSRSRNAGGLRLTEYFSFPSKDKKAKAFIINERALPDDEELSQSLFSNISKAEDNTVVVKFFEFRVRPDSIYLIEGLDNVQFHYFWPQDSEAVNSNVTGVSTKKKERDLLPTGVEIRLHWNETGIFSTRDFSIIVPIHVAS